MAFALLAPTLARKPFKIGRYRFAVDNCLRTTFDSKHRLKNSSIDSRFTCSPVESKTISSTTFIACARVSSPARALRAAFSHSMETSRAFLRSVHLVERSTKRPSECLKVASQMGLRSFSEYVNQLIRRDCGMANIFSQETENSELDHHDDLYQAAINMVTGGDCETISEAIKIINNPLQAQADREAAEMDAKHLGTGEMPNIYQVAYDLVADGDCESMAEAMKVATKKDRQKAKTKYPPEFYPEYILNAKPKPA